MRSRLSTCERQSVASSPIYPRVNRFPLSGDQDSTERHHQTTRTRRRVAALTGGSQGGHWARHASATTRSHSQPSTPAQHPSQHSAQAPHTIAAARFLLLLRGKSRRSATVTLASASTLRQSASTSSITVLSSPSLSAPVCASVGTGGTEAPASQSAWPDSGSASALVITASAHIAEATTHAASCTSAAAVAAG